MNLKDLLTDTELIKEEIQRLGKKNELSEKDYALLKEVVQDLKHIADCYNINSLKSCTASGLVNDNHGKTHVPEFLQGPGCSTELIQTELNISITEDNLRAINFMMGAEEE